MINAIANPQLPKIGERFLGTVVKTTDFGAFVSLLPGRDGLVHISKLGSGKRIAKVEDVVKVGDKLRVEIADIDNRGKISPGPGRRRGRSAHSQRRSGRSGTAPADAATELTPRGRRLHRGARQPPGRCAAPRCPAACAWSPRPCPAVRSASVGVWVGVGSRDEGPSVAGAAHFLEHLLFKGTPTRTAVEIAQAVDAVGGELNAFTAKEHTCYYAHVLDTDLRAGGRPGRRRGARRPLRGRRRRARTRRRARGDRDARRRPRGHARRRVPRRRCSASTRSAVR